MVRIGWGVLAVLLAAFAVFESVKYGAMTTAAAITFFLLPDVTLFIGIGSQPTVRGQLPRKAVPFYNAIHRPWIPLVILVAYTVSPMVHYPPLFTAALAWLAHVAMDRAVGYGLRTPDGFQRAAAARSVANTAQSAATAPNMPLARP